MEVPYHVRFSDLDTSGAASRDKLSKNSLELQKTAFLGHCKNTCFALAHCQSCCFVGPSMCFGRGQIKALQGGLGVLSQTQGEALAFCEINKRLKKWSELEK